MSAELDAMTNGAVIRISYRVDVQSVSGRWDNVEIRGDEAVARQCEAEWRAWMNQNRNTWKDVRIVKETTTAEVLTTDTIAGLAEDAADAREDR
jgi:hypothetical protein